MSKKKEKKAKEKKAVDYTALLVDGLESFADSLEAGEGITKRFNCHKVVLNLEPVPYTKELVKKTRMVLSASQSIFAQFLGVSVSTVSSWEQGEKSPSEIACRFMDEIRRAPDYWLGRLKESVRPKAIEA